MNLFDNPVTATIAVGTLGFIVSLLTWYQGRKVSDVTERSGVASNQLAAVEQLIGGLKQFTIILQADNKELRENIDALGIKLKAIVDERDALLKEMNRLNKLYKINGSNGK